MSELFGGFYRDRRVLVTGYSGFLGRWTTCLLSRMGAQVSGLSRGSSTSSGFARELGVREFTVDLDHPSHLLSTVKALNPEIVLHLAGQASVGESFNAPLETFSTNIGGCLEILRCTGEIDSATVVMPGTVAKAAVQGAMSPYTASKLAVELVVDSYRSTILRDSRTPRLGIARLGAMMGGDWQRGRLIPDVARAVRCGENVVLRNGAAVRPWQHVLDGACGMLLLAWKLSVGPAAKSAYDFCEPTAEGWSTSKVMHAFLAELGEADWPVLILGDDPSDRTGGNPGPAQTEFGWLPTLGLGETLALTAEWYRECHAVDSWPNECVDRIVEAYVRSAKSLGREWAA